MPQEKPPEGLQGYTLANAVQRLRSHIEIACAGSTVFVFGNAAQLVACIDQVAPSTGPYIGGRGAATALLTVSHHAHPYVLLSAADFADALALRFLLDARTSACMLLVFAPWSWRDELRLSQAWETRTAALHLAAPGQP